MRSSVLSQLLMMGSCLAQGDLVSLLKSQDDLSTLLELVSLVPGLAGVLGSSSNITIVAPTNKAFQELPRDIPEGEAVEYRNDTIAIGALLANHVIKGVYPSSAISNIPIFAQNLLNDSYVSAIQPFGNVTGGSYVELVKNENQVAVVTGEQTVSTVTQADIKLGPGITIHKIDTVLSFGPPLQLYTYRAGFTALNGALEAAKLNINFGLTGADVQTLNISDYTVLIPDNPAFDRIGSIVKSADTKTLQDVLSYHLIPRNIIFSTALGNVSVKSLQGTELTFTVLPDGSAWVNNAKILYPNNILYDGVAHIIDNVLSPAPFDRTNLKPLVPAAERVAFPGASSVSTALFSSASLAFAGDMMTYSTTPELLRTVAAIATPTRAGATPTGNATVSITRPPVATFTGAANLQNPAVPLLATVLSVFLAALL